MAGLFWLSDRAWEAIEPLLPINQPGARRVDDRRVISGIIHVLRVGCRWQDCRLNTARRRPFTTVSTVGAIVGSGRGSLPPCRRSPVFPMNSASTPPPCGRSAPPTAEFEG